MIGVSPRLIFLALFIAGLAYLLYRDRDKIQRSSILFYRRTKNGINRIKAIQSRFPRFWKAYGWAAAISGVLSMILAALYIGGKFVDVFSTGSVKKAGLSFVAPGLVSHSSFQPGISFIPVEYWLIGVGIVMTVHELSHGIVALSENFEINSVGWIVLGIFPGAFVEPKGERMLPAGEGEEEEFHHEEDGESSGMWDQGKLSSRIKVLGAGSFANYLTALIMILLSGFVLSMVAHPGQIYYTTVPNQSASGAGMTNGTLNSINGNRIDNVSELQKTTAGLKPGDNIVLNTSEGVFNVKAGKRTYQPTIGIPGIFTVPKGPEKTEGYIGMQFYQSSVINQGLKPYQAGLSWFISLLQTIAILNLGIGLINMLPLKPLDGGQIMGGVIENYLGESASKAFNYFSGLGMLALIGVILLSVATAL
ncbi:MAG: site-2 protease family protein [Candidatus Nanohalobium sp.]